MKKYYLYIFISLSMCLFLTGCWDRVEIENRGFTVGSAIDLVEKKEDGTFELMLTNQMVVPSGLGSPLQGGSGEQKAYKNITATGESIFEITREMSTLSSKTPFFQHMKVLVVSEDIVREPHLFGNILDVHIRDHEMRRGIRLVIVEGKAKEALNILPIDEKVPALYIESLMENNYKNASSLQPVHIGQVQELLLSKNSYTIPELQIVNDHFVKYKGAAVFQGDTNHMIYSLSDDETMGLSFLTDTKQNGPIKIKVNGHMVVIELTDVKQDIYFKNKKKENLQVDINIDVKGNIGERYGLTSVFSKSYINKVKAATERKVRALVEGTINKVQKDLKVDVLGIGDKLYRRHYDFWNTVKDDWEKGENYYSQSNIRVNVNVKIKMVGSSDKVETINK
nr:Ger(x)C family spore germination protein [Priestia megaterium]